MLPKISQPLYKITLPFSEKKLSFRPFTVGENKFLLMANETNDPDEYISAMKQIVNTCCIEEIDVDNLPIVDIEYFFLQLSARSIGEIIENTYICNSVSVDENGEEKYCGNEIKVPINITEIDIKNLEFSKKNIQITTDIGIKLKPPSFIDSIKFDISDLNFIANCIEYVFTKDGKIYYTKDTSKEDILEFLTNLNPSQFEKIEEYFLNLPTVSKKLEHRCKKCGTIHEIEIEGFADFFV